MIVLDAGVLIAHLRVQDVFHAPARAFLQKHPTEPLGASVVTLAEALVHPALAGAEDRAAKVLERLSVRSIGIRPDDARAIARLRAETMLKMPDTLALYTAERHRASVVTIDRALGRAASDRGVVAHVLEPPA